MKLLKYTARYSTDNSKFEQWKIINEAIMQNMTPELKAKWYEYGYTGIAKEACEYFGINSIYRDTNQSMTFEFTEEQWTMFALRWL